MHHRNPYRFSFEYTLKLVRRRIWLNRKLEHHAQFMAFCFFAGLFLIIGFGNYTLIKWFTICRIWVSISLVFVLLPNKWLPVIYRIHRELKLLLATFAMGSIFSGLFLMLNFFIVIESNERTFEVKKAVYLYSDRVMEIEIEVDGMQPHREARRLPAKSTEKPDSVSYQMDYGLFGFYTLTNGRLIYSTDKNVK